MYFFRWVARQKNKNDQDEKRIKDSKTMKVTTDRQHLVKLTRNKRKKRQNEACTCTSHICNCYNGGSSVCFSRWNEEKQNKQKNYIVNYGCLFIDCTLWCETHEKNGKCLSLLKLCVCEYERVSVNLLTSRICSGKS